MKISFLIKTCLNNLDETCYYYRLKDKKAAIGFTYEDKIVDMKLATIFRLKDKKAAIGFTYEDSTPVDDKNGKKSDEEESEEESDEDVETLDLGESTQV